MFKLIVVVLTFWQCGNFTYSEYGLSLVGSWLYSTIGERFYDVINFLSIIQEIQFTLNNLGNNHSLFMLYYETKTLQKLQPQNYFQAILRLQRIEHKIYWKMKLLK